MKILINSVSLQKKVITLSLSLSLSLSQLFIISCNFTLGWWIVVAPPLS